MVRYVFESKNSTYIIDVSFFGKIKRRLKINKGKQEELIDLTILNGKKELKLDELVEGGRYVISFVINSGLDDDTSDSTKAIHVGQTKAIFKGKKFF